MATMDGFDRRGNVTGDLARFLRPLVAVAAAGLLLQMCQATAQTPSCTVQPTAVPPPRQILRCVDGLAVEAEAGADYTLRGKSSIGPVNGVSLRSGAVLVDAPAQVAGRGFQISTPQAVAAVRGTRWAVDAAADKTAVFVIEGRVSVRRTTARRGVSLGPGEGVDVAADRTPLEVKRWSPARAAALLARFGR
jgi:ferric-dicitrate binding protein FerR (iron transport regulator)